MSGSMGGAIRRYNHLEGEIDAVYHRISLKLGLSDSAAIILYTSCNSGDACPLRDICRLSGLSKQTVNSSVRKLERDGFLSLRPREGREVSLFLTAQGQELVREKVLPIMAAERAAAGGLTEEELRDMIRLSQKWLSLFRKAAASLPKP